jgi:hypothetical protein
LKDNLKNNLPIEDNLNVGAVKGNQNANKMIKDLEFFNEDLRVLI